MKNKLKRVLQKLLGLENYLYVFVLFVTAKLKYDRKERDFFHFLRLLDDGYTLLDIGANIGATTVHMARRLSRSSVISFEPVPVNLGILRKVIRLFALKNVTVMDFALGGENRVATMILPVQNSVKLHGLSHVRHASITSFNEGIEFQVAMKRLDDIGELNNKQVAGIKLDVENFEFQVLSGAVKLIERCKPIIYCELWDNENRVQTMQLLVNSGYKVLVRDGKKLVPFNEMAHKTQNFFFIPEGK